ncbi:LuxR family transcriptional regulator [Izhakiella australiensis]|uniref:LuxR family transcriptional regulator n=1 Tax=Izhakiella australiensis TaxID=1926881 RepID=A0A1S8YSH1_9GAMM|nr:LuxR family transcriptional regulator [Izhakiella australiensis]OON41776.1 LuxR family transcriptional regulator [Izhakiella australiensis]
MFSTIHSNTFIADTLREYIEKKLQPYSLPSYAFTVINKKDPSKILIISSYPKEWVELYKANKFQNIDPVVLYALRRTSPFAWDENLTLMTKVKASKIFSLSKKYNIANGFTFVLHDHTNNISLLSLLIDKKNQSDLEEVIINDISKLQMTLIDINEQMNKLVQTTSPIETTHSRGQKSMFSSRENEVLYWTSMGKTYAETALILGITVRTVKFHMGNSIKKMGVNNAKQAIRLGMELGLIHSLHS